MDQTKTMALFGLGAAEWNAWAEEMLTKKADLKDAGEWTSERRQSWHQEARADFSRHEFTERARFDEFQFPGDATFDAARFRKAASFRDAEFHGGTSFDATRFAEFGGFQKATFRSRTRFHEAVFMKDVSFSEARFLSEVSLGKVRFSRDVHFSDADFKGPVSLVRAKFSEMVVFHRATFDAGADFCDATFSGRVSFRDAVFLERVSFDRGIFMNAASFSKAKFWREADFRAVRGRGVFAIHDVDFRYLPDFSEAHFEEAPLFDHIDLKPEQLKADTTEGEGSIESPARWRALKRLAIQGHDHERELEFLKGEILARRGTEDTVTQLRYWAGWIYQILSDFGRSIKRPVVWLAVSLVAFSAFYAWRSDAVEVANLLSRSTVACTIGAGDARMAAVALSVHNAVPFAGVGLSVQTEEIYACLYGLRGGGSAGTVPAVPSEVAVVGVVEFFVTAMLIFLVGLGVRNRFRIK